MICKKIVKRVNLEPTTSCIRDRGDTTETGNGEDLCTEPNSCFSDLPDSVELTECIAI